MTLAEWIEAEGMTRAAAARRFGISPSYMTELCQRKRTPSAGLAIKINEGSACRVTFRELLTEAAQ